MKKLEARRLREQGLSLSSIAAKVGVSKSSVSLWVRDIELTDEQSSKLLKRGEQYQEGIRQWQKNRKKKRSHYQEIGRQKARDGDARFMAGCMLYWAEGAKARNSIVFANTDVDMIVFFVAFLRDYYKVPDALLKVRINCYLTGHITREDVEDYWLDKLRLTRGCLRKTQVNTPPKSSKGLKAGKHPYGVCTICVDRTALVQSIYGAIQEFIGVNKPEWRDM